MPYRQSLIRADITIGPHHLGIADRWEGADGGAELGTYDAARGRLQLGGHKTREDGTATFLCDEAFWAVWPALDRGRGSLRIRVVLVPTGDDGTPYASGPVTLTGVLQTVPTPQGDFSSNEGNAIALVFGMDAERA